MSRTARAWTTFAWTRLIGRTRRSRGRNSVPTRARPFKCQSNGSQSKAPRSNRSITSMKSGESSYAVALVAESVEKGRPFGDGNVSSDSMNNDFGLAVTSSSRVKDVFAVESLVVGPINGSASLVALERILVSTLEWYRCRNRLKN